MDLFQSQIWVDFERAHDRAFVRKVVSFLLGRRQERQLLSFDQVKEKIGWNEESYIGLRAVPIKAIIGSVGRYRDFDRAFLPVRRATKHRWTSVDLAYYLDVNLPPVQLYKVGDIYFVLDGNHRVSVARERGVEFIDAEVIECRPKLPLTADVTAEDLEGIGEHAAFLEWSRLDQLRPDQDILFTIAGGFAKLREHISVHRYYLGLERQAPVTRNDAVMSWYDNVYLPVVRLIREDRILAKFPQRSEADLYLWIMDHLYFLKQRQGKADPSSAAADFVEHFAHGSLRDAIRRRIAALSPRKKTRREPSAEHAVSQQVVD